MGVGCSRCGCSKSRHDSLAPSVRTPGRATAPETVRSRAPSWELEREEALKQLRDDFKERPTVFLLSQIIMSVQFFKNFDKDKLRMMQLKQEKEEELNRSLQKDKKSAAYLGSPYEVIGEVMAYCRVDGEEPCLGHDLEYLIMHDSIAVKTSPSDELTAEEEARDYQFNMQKCRSEGYTRLRLTGRIRPPTSSHRSRRSARQSREWQKQQPPLNETDSELGVPERPPQLGGGQRGPRASSSDPASPANRRDAGAAEVRAETNINADDRPRNAKSAGGTPAGAKSGDSSRPRSADTLSDDSGGETSSSLSSNKGQNEVSGTDRANQGKGKKFLEKLGRKVNGDSSADPNLTDGDQTDEDEEAPEKPTVTVTDESGTDTKTSAEPDPSRKSKVNAGQPTPGPQQPTPNPAFHGLPGPGGFPVVNGVPMANIPASYQQAFPGQGTHVMGQGAKHNRDAQFPGHAPAQSPFVHPMGAPGPLHIPGGMPGYQHPDPDNPNPFLMHPAAPHYFPLQPGMNAYQQFAGMYPMSPQGAGWPQEQPILGNHQPYLPGVPLVNQNPAVGYGMPVFPGQPMHPGYGFMYTGPTPASHQLGTISEGRVAGKSSRRGAAGSQQNGDFLKPPQAHHGGRRKSRSNSSHSVISEYRRSSTASSTSRFSLMQDSTTTDEEADTPGLVPHHCFRKMRVRIDEGDDDDEDVWREPHYETHRLLSSERFLGVFADRFGELVQLMGRDAWLQHGGRGQLSGSVVQCREVLPSGLRTTARITATLIVPNWPSEQAFEWALRRRPERLDIRRKMRYVWPPQRVVQTILQEVGCNLVPISSRRGAATELEWELAFQQAEIKLISSLDLVHVHGWAVAKMFFTHFLSEFGCLQERHIRHLMFGMFENNFRDWHLQSLGATFVELITLLRDSVRERHLKHYFISKRNLLKNENTGDLVNAQERLQRVMENLLPNVIILMNRLQVRNEAFPTFDWQSLYDTLRMSTTEIMKKLIPELDLRKEEDQYNSRDSLSMFNPEEHAGGDDDDDGWTLTNRQRMEASYRRWLREQQKQKNKRRRQQNRASSAPGTPMPAFAGRNDKLNTLGDKFQPRIEMVLSLFIRHFSAMAERLIEYHSIDTALAYIDHSMNLCILLGEQGASQTAEEFSEKLVELQATAAAELPAPQEEVPQVDPDLLQMASGGGDAASEEHSNWVVGPEKGQPTRRDFNREAAAAAAAGDLAEWQAQGGTRPDAEGRDETSPAGNGDLFSGTGIFGEMRINPAFVEDQPKVDEEDADADDIEVVESKLPALRGDADGSEHMDERPRSPAAGRSRSASLGSDGHFIEEEEEDEDEEKEDGADAREEDEKDEDSEDTQM